MLFSFSAVVQHTPSPPVGFSILRAGLNKSVLLSVYTATSNNYCHDNPSHGIAIQNLWLIILIPLLFNRKSPKRTISASDELGLLQMVSEPNTGRCASKEDEP